MLPAYETKVTAWSDKLNMFPVNVPLTTVFKVDIALFADLSSRHWKIAASPEAGAQGRKDRKVLKHDEEIDDGDGNFLSWRQTGGHSV